MGSKSKKKKGRAYHHGDLAQSLLGAVDHIARRFGLEAVTLRAGEPLALLVSSLTSASREG